MQSVAGRVAVCEDEASAVVQAVEWSHAEPYLIEEGDDVDWVRGRAQTIIDLSGVRRVRLVIRRVKVHTIPASREKDLSPETIWTVRVGES